VKTESQKTGETWELNQLIDRMRPTVNRSFTIDRLGDLFASGKVPDLPLQGFLRGRLVAMTVWPPFDAGVRRIAGLWMPWLGKSFDPETSSGINVLHKNAAVPIKMLFPRHPPRRDLGDRIEAFPFKTRAEVGTVDPETKVLKIDYDFDPNPGFIIRDLLDELVQIDDGVFLGKILFRWRGLYRPIGYFSLSS
jgi:hypothetical protein